MPVARKPPRKLCHPLGCRQLTVADAGCRIALPIKARLMCRSRPVFLRSTEVTAMFRIDAGNTRQVLRRHDPPQLRAAGRGRHGQRSGCRRSCGPKRPRQPWADPRKDTSVILLWLDGGPGHMDMYDMKPEAPAEYRGIWNPIRTNVPGIEITRAVSAAGQGRRQVLDRPLAAPRHRRPLHRRALHAHRPRRGQRRRHARASIPSIGSIATKMLGPAQPGMPAYAAVPYATSIGLRPGYFRRQLPGPGPQPVRDQRRSERRRISRSTTSSWPAR